MPLGHNRLHLAAKPGDCEKHRMYGDTSPSVLSIRLFVSSVPFSYSSSLPPPPLVLIQLQSGANFFPLFFVLPTITCTTVGGFSCDIYNTPKRKRKVRVCKSMKCFFISNSHPMEGYLKLDD